MNNKSKKNLKKNQISMRKILNDRRKYGFFIEEKDDVDFFCLN